MQGKMQSTSSEDKKEKPDLILQCHMAHVLKQLTNTNSIVDPDILAQLIQLYKFNF